MTTLAVNKPRAYEGAPVRSGTTPARLPSVALDLRVDLGQKLRLRGRGLETGLEGELRLTSPAGKLAVDGSVRAAGGTYAAYGQKLEIARGNLVFNGPAENPRLDIEATRPNLDVRVGVQVTGTAVNPRVRLFSEPEMAEAEKLYLVAKLAEVAPGLCVVSRWFCWDHVQWDAEIGADEDEE